MSQIVGLPKAEASDLRKALEQIKRSMPEQLELMRIVAQMDFAKFEAYCAAGFKPEQAISLLRAEKIKAVA